MAASSSSSASSSVFEAGKPVLTQAAVCWEAGADLKVETVEVAPPKAGEVRIRATHCGVCHTDAYASSGRDPEGLFPVVLGHETAGVVVDVGPGVTSVNVGDHVIGLYIPECRDCKFCLSGKTNLCGKIRGTQGKGVMPDGTGRLTCIKEDGTREPLFHFMGISGFCGYCVLAEISVAVVSKTAPPQSVCLLGCGITTGYGAVKNTAKVEAGANVAVFGCGAVGLAAIMAAKEVGAAMIIAVDINPAKQAMAESFGATHFVNPRALPDGQTAGSKVVELTDGGADYTFECVGITSLMREALECCHKGWGRCTIIGVAGAGEEISTRPFQLVTGRVWGGSAFGGVRGRTELPGMVEAYERGELKVDEFITGTYPLTTAGINEAFHAMHDGKAIRSIIELHPKAK